jgi:hypothetical protein
MNLVLIGYFRSSPSYPLGRTLRLMATADCGLSTAFGEQSIMLRIAHTVMIENLVMYSCWFGIGIAIAIGIGFWMYRIPIPIPIPNGVECRAIFEAYRGRLSNFRL